MFGLTFEKLLLIAVLAVFIVGPDRLPQFAATLGKAVRWVRDFADGAKTRVRDEMGPEFDEVDWKKLDPRQYDPRRIIREALVDQPTVKPVSKPLRPVPKAPASEPGVDGGPVAFDTEAT